MPARLAQEELERVGRRLDRLDDGRRGRRRRGLAHGLLLEHVDTALLELAEERVGLERVELVELDDLRDLGLPDRACLRRRLDSVVHSVEAKETFDLHRHPEDALPPGVALSNPRDKKGGAASAAPPGRDPW